jgi:glycosyltransferase involved in cell wall biosynthesis
MSSRSGRRLLMIEQGGRGGVADYTHELVSALAAEGWQVTLATAADHRYGEIPGVSVRGVFHYTRGDSRLGRALRDRGLGRAANGLRFLAALPQLALLAARADVVHTQGWETPQIGVPALLALRATGRPVVQTTHGMFDRATTARGAREAARRLTARLTARTIVHTQADLEGLPDDFAGRAVVIPHGEYGGLAARGHSAGREQARAALGLPADAHVTLMFGQLRPDKGLDDLVPALAHAPAVHLLVGGQDLGGLSAVRPQLAELGERAVVREGFLDMDTVAELFAAADTVALPYREASQSGVLLLAYGFSRPVIIYPSGGMVEAVIDGETGWVCAEPTVAALADALNAAGAAGAAEAARRGQRGRALADERFAWPAIARRTGEVYAQVMSGAGPG